jgi:cardiolipin synthase A/B
MMTVISLPWWEVAVALLYLALAGTASVHALLYKRDPRAVWGWIAVCLLVPLAGAFLYWAFGINRVHARAMRLRGAEHTSGGSRPPLELPVDTGLHPTELMELVRIGQAVSYRPLASSNAIEALENGEQAYPAMLDAIERAQKQVLLATYIFLGDATGREFARALAAARARGVQVCVLLDGLADAWYRPSASALLREHGLQPALFLPPHVWPPMLHINLRNHRKLLLVDGATGFTGGINIADYHRVGTPGGDVVRDLHFRITGPVLRQAWEVFAADWEFAAGSTLEFPPQAQAPAPVAGRAAARVITDGPNEELDKLTMVLHGALATAHRRIWMVTPYFLPPVSLVAAMQAAALRGVEVCVFIPGRSDQPWIDWATSHMLWSLLYRGVRVFRTAAPFLHTKLLLVDDYYVQFGSANMDVRSLRLNFELVVEAYDRNLAAFAAAYAERLRAESEEVTLDTIQHRGTAARLRDAAAWLFSPYL